VEILTQIKAARSALTALEGSVMQRHLEGCVRDALKAKDSFDAEKKIREITELLGR
jgi:DNA-binding FrmR family transcriptional regulator